MKSQTYVFADSMLCLGGALVSYPSKLGKTKLNGVWNTLSQRFGSNRRGTDGIRAEKFPRIHYVGNSRRNSTDDGGIKV